MAANSYGKTYQDIDLNYVKELASKLISEQNIARLLGYNANYWWDLKKQYPELSDAVSAGRAENERILCEKLMQQATEKDNVNCLIFALKSQHKWRDTQDIEVTHRVEELNESRDERMLRIQEMHAKVLPDAIDVEATNDSPTE